MHADRTNRSALILLGLLSLLAGAAAMAISVGALGSARAKRPLLQNKVSTYVGAHGSWIWAAAAVVAVFLALVMLRWVTTLLLSTDRSGDLDVQRDENGGGSGSIRSAAVSQAMIAEVGVYRGVDSVKCRVLGDSDDPRLALTVVVDQADRLGSVRHRVESDAISHARQALDHPTMPVLLDFTIAKKPPARV